MASPARASPTYQARKPLEVGIFVFMALTVSPLEEANMQAVLAESPVMSARMLRAWNAYQGWRPDDNRVPDALVTEPGDTDDNVPVNVIRELVQAQADFLFGDFWPTIELPTKGDGGKPRVDTLERSPEEQWLDACFDANDFQQTMYEAAINGALFGTPYLGLSTTNQYPNPDAKGKPFPRVFLKDSLCMSMRWDQRDISDVYAYIWRSQNAYARQPNIPFPVFDYQIIKRADKGWKITDAYQRQGDRGLTDPQITMWPYEWPPVLAWKHMPAPNQVYGEPEVTDELIKQQAGLAFNLSYSQRLDRKHAFSKFVAVGVDVKLDPKADVWEIMEGDVELLSPNINSEALRTTRSAIYGFMLEAASVPSMVLGHAPEQGVPSGVQLLISMSPLLRSTASKRARYERVLRELCRRLWQLAGFGDNLIPKITWPELIPTDPQQERNVIQRDRQDLGIKREVLAQKVGYNLDDLDPVDPMQKPPAANPSGKVPGMPDTNQTTPGARQKAAQGDNKSG